MAKSRRTPGWTAERARELLAEADRSGMSLTDFARTAGIPVKRLWTWRHRLGKSGEGAGGRSKVNGGRGGEPTDGLLELRPMGATKRDGARQLEVTVRNGRKIGVPEGFDGRELMRLIEVLESC